MDTNLNKTLYELYNYSVTHFAARKACSFYNKLGYSYQSFDILVHKIQTILNESGIEVQDKVAILNPNGPHWAATYFAVTTSARVAVPLLVDYSEYEINLLLEHSETKALFVTSKLLSKISEEIKNRINLIVNIEDFSIIKQVSQSVVTKRLPDPMDLAVIIYTSGTTGIPKGVMLSHLNICTQISMCYQLEQVESEHVFLSLLPMSHAYECSLGMLLPFSRGASVNYIEKLPTPTILMQALKVVAPTHILTVPLIIEKLYKTKVLSVFTKNKFINFLYKISIFRKLFHRIAGLKMKTAFGGRLKFLGIGGAKLDFYVERFLKEGKLPYGIGYGLTEAAPLLAGANPRMVKLSSTGYHVNGVDIQLQNIDKKTGIGEIIAKGANIMLGYFKNSEATAKAFTERGWLRTNDLAYMDKKGRLYIKGRLGNKIIGPSGENIYPEEIEQVINQHEFVLESMVKSEKGKLIAMVYLNYEQLEKTITAKKDATVKNIQEAIEKIKNDIVIYVNMRVSNFAKISVAVEQKTAFEKTATQKIKRYKYL